MSSNQSREGEIRKNVIERRLGRLHGRQCQASSATRTQIPACLWFLSRSVGIHGDLRDDVLFIDARKLGRMVDRTHRELTDGDLASIADTDHVWRVSMQHRLSTRTFRASARAQRHFRKYAVTATSCNTGRYIGAAPQEDEGRSLSMRRWPGFRLNGGSSRPKPIDWIGRSCSNLTRFVSLVAMQRPRTLDLTSLEDVVAQLEEALDIYNSDLALDHPNLQRRPEGRRHPSLQSSAYELSYPDAQALCWSLPWSNPAEIYGLGGNDVIREAL